MNTQFVTLPVTAVSARTLRNRRKRQRRRARPVPKMTTLALASPQAPPSRARRQRARKRGGQRMMGPGGLSAVSSAYLSSVADPCGLLGAKVPDITTFQTSTARSVFRTTLLCANGGCGMLVAPSLSVNNAVGTLAFASAGADFTATITGFPQANALGGIYRSHRPVSMCIDIQYIGTALANSGVITAMEVPRGWAPLAGSSDRKVSGILSNPGAETYPVRDGVRIVWVPEDNGDYEFKDMTTFGVTSATNPYVEGGGWPALFFLYSGGDTSNGQILVTVTLNSELIPLQTVSSIINTSPSPADPVGLAKVSNYIENLDRVVPLAAAASGIGGLTAAAAKMYQQQSAQAGPGQQFRGLSYSDLLSSYPGGV